MIKLSDSELEVMKVIWGKDSTTSFEIIQALNQTKWSVNTIRTFINRLIYKRAVGISKKEGKCYYYIPLIEKDKYILKCSKDFVNQFFNGSISKCIKFLIKNSTEKIIFLLLK